MAIIYISPKKRQKSFVVIVSLLFMVIVIAVSFLALLPEIQNQLTIIPVQGDFVNPDIAINFGVVDSPKVRNLEVFPVITKEEKAGRQEPFISYY